MSGDVWGEEAARDYDRSSAYLFAPEILGPALDFLEHRAAGRPALEFAVGTGRVALPLRERGVPVTGIDLSEPMVRQLRAKPGGAELPVVLGDMATTQVPGRFGLVYLVYNTITNLLAQEEQVACFRNAARHLEPGGCFVIEVGVPELRRLPPGEHARPFHVGENHVGFDTYDVVAQRLVSHHYWVGGGAVRATHSHHRYVWPAEMDLMARLAGLDLHERWSGWSQEPFTAESTSSVSVWRRPCRTYGDRGDGVAAGARGGALLGGRRPGAGAAGDDRVPPPGAVAPGAPASLGFNLFGDLAADLSLADRAVHTWWPTHRARCARSAFAHSPAGSPPPT